MNQDETPTPKQSGSYAIMQDICEATMRALEAWRVLAEKTTIPELFWERVGAIERFQDRFGELLHAVQSWSSTPPDPQAKTRTIEGIIAARTEATDWGARWGWSL